VAQEDAH